MSVLSLPELAAEARRLSDKIDAGVSALNGAARDEADREHEYRKARAVAWQHVEGSAKEREDGVDSVTAGERRARDIARGSRQAALEALRSRRQQLSAVQTLTAALKSELEHSQYGVSA
jgi:hypothetical protein